MVNYRLSKVYRIEPIDGDSKDCYIGSTTKKLLSERMSQHKYDFKNNPDASTRSCLLFRKFGIDGVRIVLVENYPCESKNELHAREAYHIRNSQCVNKMIPLRTTKMYYQDNRERMLDYQRNYRTNEDHKIKILQTSAVYRKNNKQYIQKINQLYGIKNKIKIGIKKMIYYEKKKDFLISYRRDYYIRNKEVLAEKIKLYRENNKVAVAERKKKHYEENKQEILQKFKAYRDNNADKIKERKNKQVTCECGIVCGASNMSRHRKTKAHLTFIENK